MDDLSDKTAPVKSKSQSATAQAFWFALAKTAAFAVSIVFPFVLTRLISQHEFGLYKQAFLVATTAMRLLTMGFGLSAYYFFPRMEGREGPVATNTLIFNFAMGGSAWLALTIWPDLLSTVFGLSGLQSYSGLIGAVIFFWIFSSFIEIAPAALRDTRASGILIVGVQLTRTLLMLAATLLSASLTALLWAAVVQGILQTAGMLIYLQRRLPGFLGQFSVPIFREQSTYVLLLSAAYFIAVLHGDVPQFLAAAHFTPALYAVYAVGTFSLPLIHVLQESVGMTMIPALSRLHHENRTADIIAMQIAAMRKMAFIVLPVYFCLLVLAEPFVVLLYSARYRESAGVFAVNLLLLPLMIVLYDPVARVFRETRRFLVVLRACLLVFLVVTVWFGARSGNLYAVIVPVIVAATAERIGIGFRIARMFGMGWKDRDRFADIAKLALISAVVAIPTWLLSMPLKGLHPFWVLAVCSLLYGSLYLAGVLLARIPSAEEIATLRGLLRRFWQRKAEPVLAPGSGDA